MKDPHAKYTYKYDFIREHGDCVEVLPEERATHIAICRRQIKSDADGYQYPQLLLDIPMPEVQFSVPEKQPPTTSAALCERLRSRSHRPLRKSFLQQHG